MFETIVIVGILFAGGFAFGIASGRRPWAALPLAAVLAAIVGANLVEWSAYSSMFTRWDQFLYGGFILAVCFGFVLGPALAGAFAGIFTRQFCRNQQTKKGCEISSPSQDSKTH